MELSQKDRQAIAFVSGFLNKAIHVSVTPDLIVSAAGNKGDGSAIWCMLIDLSLLHASGFPDKPQERLNRFWQVLTEEGHEHVPVEGVCNLSNEHQRDPG